MEWDSERAAGFRRGRGGGRVGCNEGGSRCLQCRSVRAPLGAEHVAVIIVQFASSCSPAPFLSAAQLRLQARVRR